ncbi:hypothetical protein EBR57_00300 [bacterium]|nr:hypothetical protein [bacterium]
MTLNSLIIVIAPEVPVESELGRSQKSEYLSAVRQMKRMGLRVFGVAGVDCPSARYIAASMRKKNIVRRKPDIVSVVDWNYLDRSDCERLGVVVELETAVNLLRQYLQHDWQPELMPLTCIELVNTNGRFVVRSIMPAPRAR